MALSVRFRRHPLGQGWHRAGHQYEQDGAGDDHRGAVEWRPVRDLGLESPSRLTSMRRRPVVVEAMFLQAVTVLTGVAVIVFLLWEPHLEGRNAGATLFEISFHDPFLAYFYVGSVSFFVGLYQAVKVLGYAGADQPFTHAAVRAVRAIRLCALLLIAFVIVREILVLPSADELPPPLFMGLLVVFGSTVTTTAMSVLEQVLLKGIGACRLSEPSPADGSRPS